MALPKDVAYYRNRAEDLRKVAAHVNDTEARNAILRFADRHDQMADRLERVEREES
jgi:hypothetical protein